MCKSGIIIALLRINVENSMDLKCTFRKFVIFIAYKHKK